MNELILPGITALLSLLLVLTIWKWAGLKKKYKGVLERYRDIISIDDAVHEKEAIKSRMEKEMLRLQNSYMEKKEIYRQLSDVIALYENTLDLMDYGIYEPAFDFDVSEKYKETLLEIKKKQKDLVKNKEAATVSIEWTVEGSKAKGRAMSNQAMKLALRAFNGECDAMMSAVRWNNISQMMERIKRSFDAVNKLNKSNQVSISTGYLSLKINELHLTYEYEQKKQEEKEQAREIRECNHPLK